MGIWRTNSTRILMGSGEEVENVKAYRQMDRRIDRQMDGGQQAIRKAQVS
jgi:hypothetical protein